MVEVSAGAFQDCLKIQYEAKLASCRTVEFRDLDRMIAPRGVSRDCRIGNSQRIDRPVNAFNIEFRIANCVAGAGGRTGENRNAKRHRRID